MRLKRSNFLFAKLQPTTVCFYFDQKLLEDYKVPVAKQLIALIVLISESLIKDSLSQFLPVLEHLISSFRIKLQYHHEMADWH